MKPQSRFLLLGTIVLALFALVYCERHPTSETFSSLVYDSNNYDLVYHDELPIPDISGDLLNGGTIQTTLDPSSDKSKALYVPNYENSVYLSPSTDIVVLDVSGFSTNVEQIINGGRNKEEYGFPYSPYSSPSLPPEN